MSNEIALPSAAQLPAYLRNVPTRNEEFLGGLSHGLSLPILSFRGFMWRLRSGAQEVSLQRREIDLVLIRARPNLSKRFYDAAYTPGETLPPRCWSTGGVTPDSADPIAPACRGCPNNAWGSATTDKRVSKGKACTDYKRLVVWPVIDVGGTRLVQPCILDLPPTSLRAPQGSRDQQYTEFTSMVARNGIPLEAVVAQVTFSGDSEQPRLLWSFVRTLDEDEYRSAREMAEMPEVEDIITGGGVEPRGQIVEVAPAALPVARAPEPEPEPVKPARAPRAAKPAPEPEPVKAAPEQAPPSGDETTALLASINALLKK